MSASTPPTLGRPLAIPEKQECPEEPSAPPDGNYEYDVSLRSGDALPQPYASRTPRRPARSVTNCHATRPDLAPRVACHSMASAQSSASEIAIPNASQ